MVAATKAIQGPLGPVGASIPFLPCPSSFFAFWGVPGCNTQVHPSPWRVPGHTCPLPLLPSSFSFSLSLFLSVSLSLCLSVSLSLCLSLSLSSLSFHPLSFLPLDASVSWCVLGHLCRSWEHCRCFSFLCSLPSSLSLPPLFPFAFWAVPGCNTQVHLSPWCDPL